DRNDAVCGPLLQTPDRWSARAFHDAGAPGTTPARNKVEKTTRVDGDAAVERPHPYETGTRAASGSPFRAPPVENAPAPVACPPAHITSTPLVFLTAITSF